MKRLFTFSALLVATGMLFPSCGTHLTIAKRQHSKGYYVNLSKDKRSSGGEHAKTEIATEESIAFQEAGVKPGTVEPKHVVKNNEENSIVASAELDNTVIEAQEATAPEASAPAKAKVKFGKLYVDRLAMQQETASGNSFKSKVKQEAKKLSEHKKIKKMESKRAADGLSLFWIVILVLLILWLLGLLGGLGWFIHIALVVALICLILWLLGVV